eukprot:Rhum_TRINITY_DN15154_c2_g7::Rhum_TRINITY_DN15154_c2_g7_i2::g.140972::m.140972
MEADCPQPASPPVFQVVKSRELCSVRLTADLRWLDEEAKKKFFTLGPQRSFAAWLRLSHAPTFHDLRSFSVKKTGDNADKKAEKKADEKPEDPQDVLCWRAKARIPTAVVDKLLC